jgi:pimeloyl-ACP methyl ester carboxylesterase
MRNFTQHRRRLTTEGNSISFLAMGTSYLTRPEGRLAYDVQGEGPLIVTSHGMGNNRAAFRHLTPLLVAAGHRVANLDVRGHGESSLGWPTYAPASCGDDLVALTRHLGGPAVLLGSSSSAAAVPYAAAQSPDDVAGIVLASPFVKKLTPNPLMRLVSNAVMGSPTLWTMYFTSRFAAAKPADFAEYAQSLRTSLKQRGRMAAVSGVVAPQPEHWSAIAPQIRCPVLILMGAQDPDFADPAAEARLGEALFAPTAPSVATRMIADSGHYPYVDQPAATAAAILGFLKESAVA